MEVRQVHCHWSDHNAALKYSRDHKEYECGGTKEFALEGIEIIPVVQVCGRDALLVCDTHYICWCVKWMLCNLGDEDLQKVVSGPNDRGRGIVKAVRSKVDNASDAREHARKREPNSDHDIWDFVITRDDGTAFWLHPNWSNNEVYHGEVQHPYIQLQPPASGRGGSMRGQVYKHFKNATTTCLLRFDEGKNVLVGKTRAQAMKNDAWRHLTLAAVAACSQRRH